MHEHWTRDSGIFGLVGGLVGYLLAVGPDWVARWLARRDRARGVPRRIDD